MNSFPDVFHFTPSDRPLRRSADYRRQGACLTSAGPRWASTGSCLTTLCRAALSVALLLSVVPVVDAAEQTIDITYVGRDEKPRIPLSLLDVPIERDGISGAELGLAENETTGGFLGHEYKVHEVQLSADATMADALEPRLAAGDSVFIADLPANDLLALADAADDALIINARASDDRLRNDDCRSNVLHTIPSRAMLGDGLAQYLAWKRWTSVALITGRHPADVRYAQALRRGIDRYGLKLVDERNWTAVPGARRTDSGHHNAQQEVPRSTQLADHDVLLVADELDEFGEYLSYRTTRPRPVAGTQGLEPTSWDRTQEQWGATQLQRRFEEMASRAMTERDQAAWAAMRAIGEAVTRGAGATGPAIRDYLLSDDFKLAAFKGVPLSFRTWNGQLRQPILLVAPRMLVSVSPQEGFLHQHSELDTLGYDEPESTCGEF